VGQEVSSRVAYQHAGYLHVEVIRRKWVRDEPAAVFNEMAGVPTLPLPPVLIGPLPDCVWPRYMADPSAIANIAVSKYGDVLPLHRQETISKREGFAIPRSTQCGWLGGGYKVVYRIVDAMFAEARAEALYIATDATGAPVKSEGGCDSWHVFVFAAENGHIVFRYTEENTSQAISGMLHGYQGYVVADAATVFDILYREGMTESGCWYHTRKYVFKALETDPDRAYEAMAIIAKLFRIARECESIPMPERTKERAARAGPVLELFDRWVDANRERVDPKGPLDAAITYYDNQRTALRRFLDDGRLPIHNNTSERQLRNLAMGRHNYLYFANETGLKWYVTYRSLIASCMLHELNPHTYLEQVLRLAPHWPVTRMLELSPKYWTQTLARLDESQRRILTRPWELEPDALAVQLDEAHEQHAAA
jgi:transposase